jgi:hypothetical protein
VRLIVAVLWYDDAVDVEHDGDGDADSRHASRSACVTPS